MNVPKLISAVDLTSEDTDAKSVQTYITAIRRMGYFTNYQLIEENLRKLLEEIAEEKRKAGLLSMHRNDKLRQLK